MKRSNCEQPGLHAQIEIFPPQSFHSSTFFTCRGPNFNDKGKQFVPFITKTIHHSMPHSNEKVRNEWAWGCGDQYQSFIFSGLPTKNCIFTAKKFTHVM